MGGENAEIRFCEFKRLNMATLRMTWEAKVQLKEILVNSGFPEGKNKRKTLYEREGSSCLRTIRFVTIPRKKITLWPAYDFHSVPQSHDHHYTQHALSCAYALVGFFFLFPSLAE